MSIPANDYDLLTDPRLRFHSEERLYLPGLVQMWSGRVNSDSLERGTQTIPHTNGTFQPNYHPIDIYSGLLVLFGSTEGAANLGRARLLSYADDELIIHWHDDLSLQRDDWITIVHLYLPAAKFSYLTVSGVDGSPLGLSGGPSNAIFKDGPPSSDGGAGEAYDGQTIMPPPHVIMGRPLVIERIYTGAICDGSSSIPVTPNISITDYNWTVSPGHLGIFSSRTSSRTSFAALNTGVGYLHLRVTDSNGKTSIAHRPIIIDDVDEPFYINEWSRSGTVEQRDKYNISESFVLTSPNVESGKGKDLDTDWSGIQPMALAIVYRKQWYELDQQPLQHIIKDDALGPEYEDRAGIAYVGYISAVRQDLQTNGAAQVTVSTSQATLAMHLFAQSLSGYEQGQIDQWYEALGELMTTAHLAFHLLRYHSTLTEIMDIYLPFDDTVKRSSIDDWTEGDLMNRLGASVGPQGRLMSMTMTPQGELHIAPYLNLQAPASRAAAPILLTLTEGISGQVTVSETYIPQLSQVRADSFVSLDGILGQGIPIRSISGTTRLHQGTNQRNYGSLVAADQAELNYITGRLLKLNNDTYRITITLSEATWNIFSVARQSWTNTGQAFAALHRNNLSGSLALININLLPVQIVHRPEIGGTGTIEVTFETEAPEGLPGRTVYIPEITPYYAQDNPLPAINSGTPIPANVLATATTGGTSSGMQLLWGDVWHLRNGSLNTTQNDINALHLVPYWWVANQSNDPDYSMWWRGTDHGGLFFSNDGGRRWIDRTPVIEDLPIPVTQAHLQAIDVITNPDIEYMGEEVWALVRSPAITVPAWYTYLFYSNQYGQNWTMLYVGAMYGINLATRGAEAVYISYWNGDFIKVARYEFDEEIPEITLAEDDIYVSEAIDYNNIAIDGYFLRLKISAQDTMFLHGRIGSQVTLTEPPPVPVPILSGLTYP